MGKLFRDLYIEVYILLVGILGEKNALKIICVLLTALQLFNIYSIILLIDRILKIDVLGFIFTKPLIVALICVVMIFLNILTYRDAKKTLATDGPERYISRWLIAYLVLTFIIYGAHFLFKAGITA